MSPDDVVTASIVPHDPTSQDQPIISAPELQLIYDTAPIGLAFLSPDCRYLQINQRLTEICGISIADHLGRSVRETVPALAEPIENIVHSIMQTGEPVTGIEVVGQRGGHADERSWITYWHPLRDRNGGIIGINVAAEEITERKHAEAALRASEQRFHALADSIPQLVWMAEGDGNIFWINSLWQTETNIPASSIYGRDWTSILNPTHIEVGQRWGDCLKNGTTLDAELELRALDGQCKMFLTRIVPLKSSAGDVVRWIGTHVDISEQRDREEHVRFIVDELSHRTKNLLTVVMAVAEHTARHTTNVLQYRDRFLGRLKALSDCHELLAKDQWQGATFGDLLAKQMKPFRDMTERQIQAAGPSVILKPEAVHYLGLALHELATNASKHGALSALEGMVSVRWRLNETQDRFHVHWCESGGPLVVQSSRRGFGHVVIERIVPQALNGTGSLSFAPSGVNWTFEFPAPLNGGLSR